MALSKINSASLAQGAVTNTGIRNVITNGGMQIWQRGTSMASTANGSNNYTADRFWVSHNNASNVTVSQQDGTGAGIGVPYCARVQRNSGSSAANGIRFGTSLEATDVIRLRGKTLTISFYARAGANFSAASNTLGLWVYTGTDVDPNPNTFASGLWNNIVALVTPNSTLTTSWQRFTYTTNAVSSTANALILQFNFNETGTAGANDYFEITGVQLEEGSVTDFENRSYADELQRCRRYYQQSHYDIYSSYGATYNYVQWFFVPEMRTTPALSGNLTGTSDGVNKQFAQRYNAGSNYAYFYGGSNPSKADAEL
tara:strand:+ start:6884 stop:7822 length:939 start_codon:yes stop_codon:yes gene_type:complete